MRKFIKDNFAIIVLVFSFFILLKGCNDSREVTKIKNEITAIKDSTYTKKELKKELYIMSLETEKRFIQATDRKILDVQRQTQIDEELKKLR